MPTKNEIDAIRKRAKAEKELGSPQPLRLLSVYECDTLLDYIDELEAVGKGCSEIVDSQESRIDELERAIRKHKEDMMASGHYTKSDVGSVDADLWGVLEDTDNECD